MPVTPRPDAAFRLVVFEPPSDPDPTRALICRATGLHPTDANQWIARMPGIMRHPLGESEIRALLDGLYELGIPAEAWRVDALPVLTPLRPVHDVVLQDSGFQVKGLRGEPAHLVPWDRVELIAAGEVEQPDAQRDVSATGWVRAVSNGLNAVLRRPSMIAHRERTLKVAREPEAAAILVRREPRLAFRFIAGQMSYAGLGDRRQNASSANFPILLREVCYRAEQASITPSTQAFLDDGPADEYRFASDSALLDYATLRLLWAWYRRDRDAQAADDEPPPTQH
jgi:hypothetical protein